MDDNNLGTDASAANGQDVPHLRPVRGQVRELALQADLGLGVNAEAERLMTLAHGLGITTTVGSLRQAIQKRKRLANIRVERQAKPRQTAKLSRTTKSIFHEAIDDAILRLENARAYVEELEQTNVDLKAKFDQLRAVLK